MGIDPAKGKSPSVKRVRHGVTVACDDKVNFDSFFVMGRKTDQREAVAEMALTWLRVQAKRLCSGAIMVDIDDTLIDGHEAVQHGFEFMHHLYNEAFLLFPIHVVTARPDDQKAHVLKMLKKKGFGVPPDRLHLLPADQWGNGDHYVETFKWNTFLKIGKEHGGVVARFGDKLWDVAHIDALHGYMSHVRDAQCCVFFDPALGGTFSGKLPGAE